MSRPQTRQRPGGTGRQGKASNSRAGHGSSLGAQRQRLLNHLRGDSIDTIAARRELNIMHPAMRVKVLREAGHKIATIRVDRHDTEGRQHRNVALYTLMPKGAR